MTTTTALPVPFGPKYQERTASGIGITGRECVLCGRQASSKGNSLHAVVVGGGSRFARLDSPEATDDRDPGFMGSFPVGSECAKQFPAGYLERITD